MNRILTTLVAFSAILVSQAATTLPQADCGDIMRHYIYSPQLTDTITIDVWTPPCYRQQSDKRYPVIYMHDGQNLFDATTTWNHQSWNIDSIAGRLIADDVIEAPIVVGIHSDAAKRIATLMPVNGVAGIDMESGELGGLLGGNHLQGNEYVAFMAEELKPMIDAAYRTLPSREDTYVAGSSMGGLMSVYALCERPDIFGNAICMSTHWSGTPEVSDRFAAGLRQYVHDRLPSVKQAFENGYVPRLYFDHGTATIDAGYGEYEDLFIQMLREKGYGPAWLMTYVAEGAAHEEKAWSARLALPLIFMLHK